MLCGIRRFKQEEIDRLRNQRLDGLRVALQQPGSLARFVTARVVFGAGAYGHSVNGTPESFQAIRREDIVKFYRSITCRGTLLSCWRDVTLEQGKDLRKSSLATWKNEGAAPNESILHRAGDWKPEDVVIDMPEAGQAAVALASR